MLVTQLTGTYGTEYSNAETIDSTCYRASSAPSSTATTFVTYSPPPPLPPPSPPNTSPPPGASSDDAPCFDRDTTTACRLTNAEASPALAFEHCFGGSPADDADAVARRVLMTSLVSGDIVLADEATVTTVVVNQHRESSKASSMITLHDDHGPILSVTPDHALFVDGTIAPASDVKRGSILTAGRRVEAVTTSLGGIVNPHTVTGTILAAHGTTTSMPVVAATAGYWIASVVLSSYPPYTLSFHIAHTFPNTVQSYWDAWLEPSLDAVVPVLAAHKESAPAWLVGLTLVLGDLLLAVGFLAFFLSTDCAMAGVCTALLAQRLARSSVPPSNFKQAKPRSQALLRAKCRAVKCLPCSSHRERDRCACYRVFRTVLGGRCSLALAVSMACEAIVWCCGEVDRTGCP
eukprot:2050239-Prymnesium_polylepis.1